VQVVQGLIILTVAGAALWADRKGAGK
jgi:hypothetical protein